MKKSIYLFQQMQFQIPYIESKLQQNQTKRSKLQKVTIKDQISKKINKKDQNCKKKSKLQNFNKSCKGSTSTEDLGRRAGDLERAEDCRVCWGAEVLFLFLYCVVVVENKCTKYQFYDYTWNIQLCSSQIEQ